MINKSYYLEEREIDLRSVDASKFNNLAGRSLYE